MLHASSSKISAPSQRTPSQISSRKTYFCAMFYINNSRHLARKYAVSYEEQTMSKDKYPSIFSPQIEAIVFIILQTFFATHAVLKIGEYSRIFPSFSWGIFGHVTRLGQSRASEKIWWIIIFSILYSLVLYGKNMGFWPIRARAILIGTLVHQGSSSSPVQPAPFSFPDLRVQRRLFFIVVSQVTH